MTLLETITETARGALKASPHELAAKLGNEASAAERRASDLEAEIDRAIAAEVGGDKEAAKLNARLLKELHEVQSRAGALRRSESAAQAAAAAEDAARARAQAGERMNHLKAAAARRAAALGRCDELVSELAAALRQASQAMTDIQSLAGPGTVGADLPLLTAADFRTAITARLGEYGAFPDGRWDKSVTVGSLASVGAQTHAAIIAAAERKILKTLGETHD